MGVSATPFTPKLMHMPHNFAQSTVATVVAAEAAASVSPEWLCPAHCILSPEASSTTLAEHSCCQQPACLASVDSV